MWMPGKTNLSDPLTKNDSPLNAVLQLALFSGNNPIDSTESITSSIGMSTGSYFHEKGWDWISCCYTNALCMWKPCISNAGPSHVVFIYEMHSQYLFLLILEDNYCMYHVTVTVLYKFARLSLSQINRINCGTPETEAHCSGLLKSVSAKPTTPFTNDLSDPSYSSLHDRDHFSGHNFPGS